MINRCSICHDPKKREAINRMLAAKVPDVEIHRRTSTREWIERGFTRPIKTLTISRHRRHLAPDLPNGLDKITRAELTTAAAKIVSGRGKSPAAVRKRSNDLAELVNDIAVEKLKAGELHVSTKDGLAARALLDRREEKSKDRSASLLFAALVAASHAPASVLPAHTTTIIEAEARTVE